nr:CD0415/CD1112 family protein [uncultured Tyzzerella sp.]
MFEMIGDFFSKLIAELCRNGLENIFNNINATAENIGNELGTNPADYNSAIFSLLEKLSETVIVPIAGMILTVVIIINLFNSVLDERQRKDPIELYIKFFLKTIIAILLTTNAFKITNYILEMGQGIVEKAIQVLNDDTVINLNENLDNFQAFLETLSVGKTILIGLTLFITYIIIWIIHILSYVVILGRFIEIFMRIALSPLAFSTFFSREFNGIGFNFVKGMIAITIQAFLIMVVIALYKGMLVNLVVDISTEESLNLFLVQILATSITLIFSLFQTNRIANSIFNAN